VHARAFKLVHAFPVQFPHGVHITVRVAQLAAAGVGGRDRGGGGAVRACARFQARAISCAISAASCSQCGTSLLRLHRGHTKSARTTTRAQLPPQVHAHTRASEMLGWRANMRTHIHTHTHAHITHTRGHGAPGDGDVIKLGVAGPQHLLLLLAHDLCRQGWVRGLTLDAMLGCAPG